MGWFNHKIEDFDMIVGDDNVMASQPTPPYCRKLMVDYP